MEFLYFYTGSTLQTRPAGLNLLLFFPSLPLSLSLIVLYILFNVYSPNAAAAALLFLFFFLISSFLFFICLLFCSMARIGSKTADHSFAL